MGSKKARDVVSEYFAFSWAAALKKNSLYNVIM